MKYSIPIVFLYLLTFSNVFAQEFGGNPPSMKWMQIDTDTVRIIFPPSREKEAQRVANTVHYLNKNVSRSIGDKQKKIDIVLQNQTVISNGYVGLAPFRSEFYLSAPQNNFGLGSNWMDVLSIHEYRHALQFMNTRRGITNIGYILTGELGWSYLSNLSIPNWFWEGDAVVSETALTAQGRGRIPSFYNGYKSLAFDQKIYDYQKARNGSIKDFVPNHYELGYLLCNYGREQYQNDFWKNIINDASRYKGVIYPFSNAIKRQTNLSVKDYYQTAFDNYKKEWPHETQQSGDAQLVNSINKKKTFTSYQYPQITNEGNLIVQKASYKRIGGFYLLDSGGKEQFVINQGRVIDNYFSLRNDKLLWAELGQDKRWGWKTYSNVVIYDLQTKKRKRITSSERYFSPDLSHDEEKIIVFSITPEQNYQLKILSADDGLIIGEIPNSENFYYSYPKWSDEDKTIIAQARDKQGRVAIVRTNVSDGDHTILVPFTNHQLGIPYETKDHIYFAASYSGVDNIFALDKIEKTLYQVTNRKLGAYQASVDESSDLLYFSEFSSMGNNVKSLQLDQSQWLEFSVVEPVEMPQYETVSVEEEGGDITSDIPNHEFATKKYPKSKKLINIHSWSFFFADPNYEWAFRSNNILNTLDMSLGVRYNRNDNAFTYFFDASYSQYYPVLTFGTSIGRRNARVSVEDEEGNVVGSEPINWWESIVRPGVTLPFNISSGLYNRRLNLTGLYSYTKVNFDEASEALSPEIVDFDYHSYTAGVSFINRRKKAKQNIYSKYGQYLAINYDRSIDYENTHQLFADSEFSFPGVSSNHNTVFQASFQKEAADNFPKFSDNFVYSRGYNRPIYDHIYKIGSNYHLPIFYPDWGFWGIIYIYRLRANAFFDYSRAHYVNNETGAKSIQMYNSIGGELMLDTKVLNLYDFTFGFRYSYLLNDDPLDENLKQSFELFIPLLRF